MLHPDNGSVESWTAEGSAEKMKADFVGWEPRSDKLILLTVSVSTDAGMSVSVQKLLALVPSTLNWTLMDRAPLKTWIHKDGKVALLGDACHPMLVSVLSDLKILPFSL